MIISAQGVSDMNFSMMVLGRGEVGGGVLINIEVGEGGFPCSPSFVETLVDLISMSYILSPDMHFPNILIWMSI